jgi:SAM-dependent methyltransferase
MNCDPIANVYRWIEYAAFGPVLERVRSRWLPELAGAQRVLVLGDGDGRFLSRLAKRYPSAEVHYIDSSARMLALAHGRIHRERLPNPDRLQFTLGDARFTAITGQDYDLVVSHFFLDCFDDQGLSELADHIGLHLALNARWAVSDFREPEGGFLAPLLRLHLQLMFAFFRYTCSLETKRLPDYSLIRHTLGLAVSQRADFLGGFVFSEIWSKRPAPEKLA